MVELNFGTLYSLLIIFCYKKFVSENIRKMKAKFLVETSQYQWLFPLSRSKRPIDPCQSDWISLEYLWFSASLSSAPSRMDSLGSPPAISPPTPFEDVTWGGRNDGDPLAEEPGCHVPPGPSRTVCELSVMPVPSGTDTPCPSSFPLACYMSDAFPV